MNTKRQKSRLGYRPSGPWKGTPKSPTLLQIHRGILVYVLKASVHEDIRPCIARSSSRKLASIHTSTHVWKCCGWCDWPAPPSVVARWLYGPIHHPLPQTIDPPITADTASKRPTSHAFQHSFAHIYRQPHMPGPLYTQLMESRPVPNTVNAAAIQHNLTQEHSWFLSQRNTACITRQATGSED